MKFGNLKNVFDISLFAILIACYFQSAQGLKCYTCEVSKGVDEQLTEADEACATGVATSPSLLKECNDTAPPGQRSYCVYGNYKANAEQRRLNLRIVLRYCQLMPFVEEGCVNRSATFVWKDRGFEEFRPEVISEFEKLEAPAEYCYCLSDGCNSKIGY